MAIEPGGTEPSQEDASLELNDDDENVWRLWQQALVMQDPWYHGKGLAHLGRRAMVDEEFRYHLVNDTEDVLNELPSDVNLPEGMRLRFLENTPDTLNVVLPPRAGGMSNRLPAFRTLLESRTSPGVIVSFLRDDFNWGKGADADIRDFLLITRAAVEIEPK